jgi:putative hydrolase of HD superfamily
MAPFATEPVDLGEVRCRMALVHDIVEIDAGDTFAYSTRARTSWPAKEAREQAAADRLFGLLPEAMGPRCRDLWDEYERGDTPEAAT